MNRVQNQASVFFCDIDNFNCQEVLHSCLQSLYNTKYLYIVCDYFFTIIAVPTLIITQMFMLKNENGWVEFTSPRFSSSGDKMIFIKPEDQGDGLGSYRHIVRYDETTKTTQPLTRGRFTVIDILGWNENKNEMWVHCTVTLKCM